MSMVGVNNIVFVPIMKIGVEGANERIYAADTINLLNRELEYKTIPVCSRAPNLAKTGAGVCDLSTTVGRVTSLEQEGNIIVARLELYDATLLADVRGKHNVQFTTATITSNKMVGYDVVATVSLFICVYAIDTACSAWKFPNGEWESVA